MASATDAISITDGWQRYWAEAGAVIQLTFITPDPKDCRNDKAAYDELVRHEKIAQLSLSTRIGLNNPPANGHNRISDVIWSAWVVVVKPGRLGEMLPEVIRPCGGKDQYKVMHVNRMRASGNKVQNTIASLNNQYEKFADGAGLATFKDGVKAGEKISDAIEDKAKDVADDASDVVKQIAGALLIPALLAVAVYALVSSRSTAA